MASEDLFQARRLHDYEIQKAQGNEVGRTAEKGNTGTCSHRHRLTQTCDRGIT